MAAGSEAQGSVWNSMLWACPLGVLPVQLPSITALIGLVPVSRGTERGEGVVMAVLGGACRGHSSRGVAGEEQLGPRGQARVRGPPGDGGDRRDAGEEGVPGAPVGVWVLMLPSPPAVHPQRRGLWQAEDLRRLACVFKLQAKPGL